MKTRLLFWNFILILVAIMSCNAQQPKPITTNPLTPEEERVILHKGTEAPFTGKYYLNKEEGVYTCKYCNAILFRSSDKFESECGWPSFDNEVPESVKKVPDADGRRVEIICNRCGGHLGHIFTGEQLTPKNTRYCVNSISLNFIPTAEMKVEKAYFAAGCFWGVQHYFDKAKGVVETTVGYMGGRTENPTYKEVCTNTTGHIETIEVVYDPLQTSFEEVTKLFFEIHDPTQTDGQGPDIGEQYLSIIFYRDEAEKATAEKLIQILYKKGIVAETQLRPAQIFWKAEDYHQHYYDKNGKEPYCHVYTKRF